MKNKLLTLAFSFMFLSASQADTPPTVTSVAREIVNALQMNEAHYVKIMNLELARRAEASVAGADVTAINKKYSAALLELLNEEQQKVYMAFAKEHPNMQLAQL